MPGWLAALVPILIEAVFKVLVALGVALVANEGLDAFFDYMWSMLEGQLGKMPMDFLNLFNLAGGGEALNIVIGAFNLVVGYKAGQKSWQFVGDVRGKK